MCTWRRHTYKAVLGRIRKGLKCVRFEYFSPDELPQNMKRDSEWKLLPAFEVCRQNPNCYKSHHAWRPVNLDVSDLRQFHLPQAFGKISGKFAKYTTLDTGLSMVSESNWKFFESFNFLWTGSIFAQSSGTLYPDSDSSVGRGRRGLEATCKLMWFFCFLSAKQTYISVTRNT